MDAEELAQRFPRLYHLAADGSWPSIAGKGLLSTTAILDLYQVPEPRRSEIEAARRPDSVVLEHPQYGRAVIRDNKPLLEARLKTCLLDGLTLVEWYRLLNSWVFFWPTRRRVETLLRAAAYRDAPQLVIMVDTSKLLSARGDEVYLSTINTGATRPFAWPRGRSTFQSIAEFDFEARRQRGQQAIAEVAVKYAVPDMVGVAKSVVRHLPDGGSEVLWLVDE